MHIQELITSERNFLTLHQMSNQGSNKSIAERKHVRITHVNLPRVATPVRHF